MDPSGPNWLMTGSSRGHLTLWDMRFQLAVKSIQLAQVTRSIDTDRKPAIVPYHKGTGTISRFNC